MEVTSVKGSNKTFVLITALLAVSQFTVIRSSAERSISTDDSAQFAPQVTTCGDDKWDPQFNPNGTSEDIYAMEVSGTDIYLGGFFYAAGTAATTSVARFDTVTQTWSGLGAGVGGTSPIVYSIAISGTDVYVGGTFTSAGSVAANRIAKYDTLTSTWSALGTGIAGTNATVNALAFIGTDLYAGGVFTTAGGVSVSNIAKWDTLTQTWAPVTTGVSGTVRAMAVNGTDLYVSGSFGSAGGVTVNNVAFWNGSAWSALISGMTNGVSGASYALDANGTEVYITSANSVIKWDGSTLTSIGGPTLNTLKAVRVVGSDVFAGGIANSLGRWNGTSWSALGSGIVTGTEGVFSIRAVGGFLFVAGRIVQAGGIGVFRIAKYDLTAGTWSPIGGGNGIGGFFGIITLGVVGTDVYVAGDFRAVGTLAGASIARWDSVAGTWSTLGSGVNGGVQSIVADGGYVYVAGSFTTAGGAGASNIARWDPSTSTWSALGSGLNSSVSSIAVSNGVLYAVGGFTMAGGVAVSRAARYDLMAGTWSAMGTGFTGLSNPTRVAASGNLVFVGGDFTTAGGVSAARIARFDPIAGTWSGLGGGISGGTGPIVYAIAIDGTDLYAGGIFTTAGGIAANNIARWNGTAWSALGSGVSNPAPISPGVFSIAVNNSNVYAGGTFATAGGMTVNHIAKWNGVGWTGLGSGLNPSAGVTGIGTMGNDVYIVGSFSTAGNKGSMGFGRYSDVSAVWSGAVDSNWHNPGNWVDAVVPEADENVLLPASGAANEPSIMSPVNLCGLTIKPGRTLNVAGGGGITVEKELFLQGNNITVADPAVVTVGVDSAFARSSGHVIGNLRKNVTGPGNFVYTVGTSTGYTPVTINFDTGAGDFTVRANSGTMSGLDPTRSLQMNWNLASNGISQADITVQYLQSDVPGTASEQYFVFQKNSGGTLSTSGINTLDTTNNIASRQNVTQFSDWTLAEPSAVGCLAGQATWDGGGPTNNWSDGTNWLCDSAPTSTDIVYFDNRNSKDVTIDQPIILGGLQMNPGFAGTISQGLSNVTLNGNFLLRSGNWGGGSGDLTVNGNLTKQAGSFNGGSGNLDLNGNLFVTGALTMTSGTASISGADISATGSGFAHNNGTIVLDPSGPINLSFPSSTNLNNLTYNTSGSTVTNLTTVIILGSLDLSNGSHSGSALDARGNVTVGSGFDGGSGTFQFSGTANQTFINNGGVNTTGAWVLNKTGGTINLASDLDLSGGSGNIILTSGTITTGTNLVNAGVRNISRTSGRIIGNLRRSYNAVGTKTFDVGTANGYAPVAANVTTLGVNPSSLTVSSDQTTYTGMNPAQSAVRYWTISESGDLTANLTFTYLQTDVVGSEPDYKLYRWEGAVPELMTATLNTTTNTYVANGISSFSDWTIGNLAPSAANVSISGRVVSAYGNGISNSELTVTDNEGQTKRALTSGFGYYRLDGLDAGRTYVLRVRAKRYTFANPVRVIVVNDDLTGEDFVAEFN